MKSVLSQVWQWHDFPETTTILCYAKQPMRLLHFAWTKDYVKWYFCVCNVGKGLLSSNVERF